MSTAKQLHDFQEVDQQIKSQENSLKEKISQQRDSDSLIAARDRLASERQRVEDLKKRQRALETDVSDLVGRIAVSEDQLYGGRIRNPKELSNLQTEINAMKAKRDEQETQLLDIMDQLEAASQAADAAARILRQVETQWQADQRRLSVEIEQLKTSLDSLHQSLHVISGEIDSEALNLYHKIKQSKGHAVARVEQGVCRSCRLSLSSHEVQQARSGRLVTCSSCSRILYLP